MQANEGRSSSSTTESRAAMIVAVRNMPEKNPVSPIGSPTPISLMAHGCPCTQTSNRPDTTTKTESEGVFWRTRTSPRCRLTILACDQIAVRLSSDNAPKIAVSCSSDNARKIAVERSSSAVFKWPGSVAIVARNCDPAHICRGPGRRQLRRLRDMAYSLVMGSSGQGCLQQGTWLDVQGPRH